MGRAHDRGKRPADDEPLEGHMSAMQRAVTGLYAQRGTTSHVNGTRKDSSERRYPLQRPKLSLPYARLKQYAVL
jgi:hypothetical protein